MARAEAAARQVKESHDALEAAEQKAQHARSVLVKAEANQQRTSDLVRRLPGSVTSIKLEKNRELQRATSDYQEVSTTALARRADAERFDGLADVAMGLVRRAQEKLDKAEGKAEGKRLYSRAYRRKKRSEHPTQPKPPKPTIAHLPPAEEIDRDRARLDPEYRAWALRRGLL